MLSRDGHIRVLPLHVANKIAAGEVVERPASVVKELVENAIDAGAKNIRISISQGGRKLVAVQDDGCGMCKDDAVLSLERQATSKIRDVNDIEEIDTLGFRGEAIPSIASVSRFTITTRRHDSDEGTLVQVNAGELAEVRAAGCPPGTLVEVRDLFCNVPARRKFLRAYATEENHVKQIFTVHALAHPAVGFSLTVDGRELYRLAPAATVSDRLHDIFGPDFVAQLLPVGSLPGVFGCLDSECLGSSAPDTSTSNRLGTESEPCRPERPTDPNTQTPKHPNTASILVSGYIERPNQYQPTRRDQYVFINGRPATAPSITYAIREAYPRVQGDVRPAAVLFIELPPNQVDVNVHPTKREVRFRDNNAVKSAIIAAIESAVNRRTAPTAPVPASSQLPAINPPPAVEHGRPAPAIPAPESIQPVASPALERGRPGPAIPAPASIPSTSIRPVSAEPVNQTIPKSSNQTIASSPTPLEFAIEPDSTGSRPWKWFKFLANTESGYLLIETDEGVVTINPHAARERIAFEKLLSRIESGTPTNPNVQAPKHPNTQTPKHPNTSQTLLIPETVQLPPVDFARVKAALPEITAMGFSIEEFGRDTFKVDAVPQLVGSLAPSAMLSTIARDLAEGGARRGGARWKEEIIAKSIARSFAGMSLALTEKGAMQLVEELASCRVPYVDPRGKITMFFLSTRELNRKFSRD